MAEQEAKVIQRWCPWPSCTITRPFETQIKKKHCTHYIQ